MKRIFLLFGLVVIAFLMQAAFVPDVDVGTNDLQIIVNEEKALPGDDVILDIVDYESLLIKGSTNVAPETLEREVCLCTLVMEHLNDKGLSMYMDIIENVAEYSDLQGFSLETGKILLKMQMVAMKGVLVAVLYKYT